FTESIDLRFEHAAVVILLHDAQANGMGTGLRKQASRVGRRQGCLDIACDCNEDQKRMNAHGVCSVVKMLNINILEFGKTEPCDELSKRGDGPQRPGPLDC
ncbi:MAG: hypothetical protein H7274_07735, partial [Rhodoferax sp.]|nr:hypothetical protein [Rhodoferax sp.]